MYLSNYDVLYCKGFNGSNLIIKAASHKIWSCFFSFLNKVFKITWVKWSPNWSFTFMLMMLLVHWLICEWFFWDANILLYEKQSMNIFSGATVSVLPIRVREECVRPDASPVNEEGWMNRFYLKTGPWKCWAWWLVSHSLFLLLFSRSHTHLPSPAVAHTCTFALSYTHSHSLKFSFPQ